MDYKYFLHTTLLFLTNPSKSWESIDSGTPEVNKIRNSFLLPIISIIAVSAFAGSLIFTNAEMKVIYSVFTGIKVFGSLFLTTYISVYLMSEITYPLDLGKNKSVSYRLIVFSLTPFFICQVFSRLLESLLFINVIGLFGLYIFWSGAEKLLQPPSYKKVPLLIATTASLVAVYIITDMALGMLTDRIYYAFFA